MTVCACTAVEKKKDKTMAHNGDIERRPFMLNVCLVELGDLNEGWKIGGESSG